MLLHVVVCATLLSTGERAMADDTPEVLQLLADVDRDDPVVRAKAARRLQELGHLRALEACLKTLDDAPDSLHADYTPSVGSLIAIGKPALAPLVERLGAPAQLTRMRATNAVLGITKKMFGFDTKSGWPHGAEQRWDGWWGSIGYSPVGDEAGRMRAIARLRAWRGP